MMFESGSEYKIRMQQIEEEISAANEMAWVRKISDRYGDKVVV